MDISFGSGPGEGIAVFGEISADRRSVLVDGASAWKAGRTIADFHGPAIITTRGMEAGRGMLLLDLDRKHKSRLKAFVEDCSG
ncbi:MAG: hypothetical protein Alpg2KO_34460 [Alphaproteobacteria bacterium]